ncbi:MAG: ABC transporter permease [Prosthecobacter sp.]|uniref:ABC transporter permease n=1 Tax=Prosthecobacter sp. TaxID=1965333 RepID=UPI00390378B5
MIRFLISRSIQGIIVIFAVICVMFAILKSSPGGPFRSERAISPEAMAAKMAHYGLDQPWPVQLWRHLVHYATFDFEESYLFAGRTVDEVIASGFPVSAAIAIPALLIALGIGVPLGALAALRPNTLEDRGSTLAATLGICTPSMVLGPLIAMFFGLKLRWFNTSGWFDTTDWVLPAITLGIIYSAYIARLTRGSLRETLAQEFIRTAKAKGAGSFAIIFRHALKLACLPVLNFLGPAAAGLLTGSFIVETVFQLPGLGQFFIAAAVNNDHALATAISVFYAALIVGFNLLVDILQAWLNPRIRLQA